jgi:hypothetical protein
MVAGDLPEDLALLYRFHGSGKLLVLEGAASSESALDKAAPTLYLLRL